jgi:autotransporter translocation and assembly factor TamB
MRELEKTARLDELRFKTELFGPERSARLTVGKYVRKGVYVSYSHDLFAGAKDEYKVEYYLWKGSSIVGSRDEDGRYNLGVGFKVRY